jgi:UPF0755 protein
VSEEKPPRDFSEFWRWLRNAFAVLVSLSVLIAGGWFVVDRVKSMMAEVKTSEDYIGEGSGEIEVVIPAGSGGSQIAQILVEADVIKTVKSFQKAARAAGDPVIQAGKFKLRRQMPANLALTMLQDTKNIIRNTIRFPEGNRLSQQQALITKATGIKKKDIEKVFNAPKTVGVPDWNEGKTIEGFLFPDTYELPDNPTAKALTQSAVKQFNAVIKSLDFTAKARENKVSSYQALIVASIIDKEVNRPEDRPKVAQVIYNRIAKKMKLEMDSTTAYGVGKTGVMELSSKDLKSKSPYNTREFAGLPPGPITSPSKAALEAAVNPQKGKWLYFVVVDPAAGDTEFSETYEDFLKSKAKYKAWCQATDENYKVCFGKDR